MHYNTVTTKTPCAMMARFLEVFCGAQVICVPSSSCVAMMRDHYPKMALASGDPALEQAVKNLLPRIFEFSELLVDKLGVTDVELSIHMPSRCITSCHAFAFAPCWRQAGEAVEGGARSDAARTPTE